MTDETTRALRRATIAALARRWGAAFGRTALMKSLYFLQTLRGVPLGYRFTLYTYGPYDKEVLYDLAQAETEGAVKSRLVTYASGNQGYVLDAGSDSEHRREAAASYQADIEWLVGTFKGWSAGALEIASTLVFVERTAHRPWTVETLASQVHEIKPHVSKDRIATEARRLKEWGLIQAAAA